MKLSEQLEQDQECGDFGRALEGDAERAPPLEERAKAEHCKNCQHWQGPEDGGMRSCVAEYVHRVTMYPPLIFQTVGYLSKAMRAGDGLRALNLGVSISRVNNPFINRMIFTYK